MIRTLLLARTLLFTLFIALFSLFIAVCGTHTAKAQSLVQFSEDSVRDEYTPCRENLEFVRLYIVNHGTTANLFHIRFLDESPGWVIHDMEPGVAIEDISIAAGDSFWIDLHYYYSNPQTGWYDDTLVSISTSGNDTLVLHGRQNFVRLEAIGDLEFGMIPFDSSVHRTIRIANTGNRTFVPTEIRKENALFTGFNRYDSLHPGDTVTIGAQVLTSATPRDVERVIFEAIEVCGYIAIEGSMKRIEPKAHWMMMTLADSIGGCVTSTLKAEIYRVSIANTTNSSTHIDSISIEPPASGWSFDAESVRNVEIPSRSYRPLDITWTQGAKRAKLTIHSSNAKSDVLELDVVEYTVRPYIRNAKDTLRFNNVASGDSMQTWFTISNSSVDGYRLKSAEVLGDSRWSVVDLDTMTSTNTPEFLNIYVLFAGASEPGEYHATILLRGTPCDSVLVQHFVARVVTSDVAPKHTLLTHIYPQPATTQITVEHSEPFSYTLIDMLGNEVRAGSSDGLRAKLTTEGLPRGSYTLQLHMEGGITSKRIVLH